MTKFQIVRLASLVYGRSLSQRRSIMKSKQTLNFVKLAVGMILVIGLSASALASCGDSLSALAAGAASVQSQSRPVQQNSGSAGDNSSMVGLWHIQFTVGDQTIQEALASELSLWTCVCHKNVVIESCCRMAHVLFTATKKHAGGEEAPPSAIIVSCADATC